MTNQNQEKPGFNMFKTAIGFTNPGEAVKYVQTVIKSAEDAASKGGLSDKVKGDGVSLCFVDVTRLLGFADALRKVVKKAGLTIENKLPQTSSEILDPVKKIDQEVIQSGAIATGYGILGNGKSLRDYLKTGAEKLEEYKGDEE
ncbi:hypothetical protein HY498_05520 [Candidatus Woesearchaeota archaeon]|nr:hypothetical protein [Candidatus Woesearchaeota archaeon]